MRRLILLVLLACLGLAPPAAAKEILSVKACGPDSCVTTEDDDIRAALMNGGAPTAPPGDSARAIALQARIGDGSSDEVHGTFLSAWVPEWRMLIGEDGGWMRLPAAERALDRLADQLGTFPARKLHELPLAERELPTAAPPARPAPPTAPEPRPASDSDLVWLLIPGAAALLLAAMLVVRRPREGATS